MIFKSMNIIILCLLVAVQGFAFDTHSTQIINDHQNKKNYCYDKQSWKEWSDLVAKHPHDMEIQTLHAIRLGLCKKIEDGTISFETANQIFNKMHESVINNTDKQQKLHKENSRL